MSQTEKNQLDWLSTVAKNSKETPELVREILSRYNIRQSPNIGNPRRLIISRIQFSGTKSGKCTEAFKFDFKNLKAGLFGVISDRNFRGKTSTLEIVRWLLRGKSSSKLQNGVKSWISDASLEFLIDNKSYQVQLSQTSQSLFGKLVERLDESQSIEISRFASEDEFETCMSDFMMRQLTLDITSAWRKSEDQDESGSPVFHDWSALSGVLFIGSSYEALFGDLVLDGLNNRLMNMYLGLPWIPTLAALITTQKKLQDEESRLTNQGNLEQRRKQERRTQIQNELAQYRASLEQLPSDIDMRRNLARANKEYRQSMQNLSELDNELYSSKQSHEEIYRILQQDKRDLQNFREAEAASAFFKRLEPTCCPHCQTSISENRRLREMIDHSCSICGEIITDSEDIDIIETELKNRLEASSKAFEESEYLVLAKEKQKREIELQVSTYELECKRLEEQTSSFEKRYELEKKITGLEYLLIEYQDNPLPQESEKNDLGIDRKIIAAAIKETKNRVENLQKDLLEEVSTKIQEYATSFGMTSITSVNLTSNPHLRLIKDGLETTYSKCTNGEKLRLKIASIIALISIAEKRGIGRHPGILLIDSPKAEEMVEEDVDNLVGGLFTLTKDLPHIQIILAATSSESILRYLDEDHRKYAQGDSFLW
jgi:hypothetical protein